MDKLDLIKSLGDLFKPPSSGPVFVDVPEMRFLMIDGRGDPNTSAEYETALQTLFSLSYTLKFAIKKGPDPIDYKVMPLEGLWWADDMSAFATGKKDTWRWTAMIGQPELVTQEMVDRFSTEVSAKKGPLALDRVRLEPFAEGRCAQVMHIGPYAEEGPTIEKLHAFIAEYGMVLRGKHHEIYMGDPRRSAPERLKTIIRQPVADRSIQAKGGEEDR